MSKPQSHKHQSPEAPGLVPETYHLVWTKESLGVFQTAKQAQDYLTLVIKAGGDVLEVEEIAAHELPSVM